MPLIPTHGDDATKAWPSQRITLRTSVSGRGIPRPTEAASFHEVLGE
jgi:hypothetical protein